jgi:asparagine synthase (glutamine-hydrolysing)
LNTPSQTNEHPLHAAAYDLLHSGICGRGSEVEDAGWNRVNLETRSPLLDLRMLAFLLRLPPVPWCMKKELCRRAMQDLLPQPILSRPKTPLKRNPVEVAGEIQQEWLACLPKSRAGRIESFVNWEKWCETLFASKGSFNSAILRPAGLFFWLKAVET